MTNRPRIRLAIAVGALAIAGTSDARAFRTELAEGGEPVGWGGTPPSVALELHESLLGLGNRAAVDLRFQRAIGVWNDVSCSVVRLQGGGTATDAAIGDGRSSVVLLAAWPVNYEESAAATTEVVYASGPDGERIIEADIFLNGEGFEWTLDASPETQDFQAVLAHEVGHLLGLLHPCGESGAPECGATHEDSMMLPQYSGSPPRELGEDDAAGLCFLYPTTGSPGGCATACLPSLECIEGECVTPGSCAIEADCPIGTSCRDGSCTPLAPSLGDPCTADSECGEGACSLDGFCSLRCAADEGCPSDSECSEGWCAMAGAAYGESCNHGRVCASNLCLLSEGTGTCTRGCDGRSCPTPDTCDIVDGRAICVATQDAGGCSAGSGSGHGGTLFAPLMLLWLRRRRIQ